MHIFVESVKGNFQAVWLSQRVFCKVPVNVFEEVFDESSTGGFET